MSTPIGSRCILGQNHGCPLQRYQNPTTKELGWIRECGKGMGYTWYDPSLRGADYHESLKQCGEKGRILPNLTDMDSTETSIFHLMTPDSSDSNGWKNEFFIWTSIPPKEFRMNDYYTTLYRTKVIGLEKAIALKNYADQSFLTVCIEKTKE